MSSAKFRCACHRFLPIFVGRSVCSANFHKFHQTRGLALTVKKIDRRKASVPPVLCTQQNFSTSRHSKQQTQQWHFESTQVLKATEKEYSNLCAQIRKELTSTSPQLTDMATYHFNGHGKGIRPVIAMLMAKACNKHNGGVSELLPSQYQIAMVAEMIHTASLVHDDMIDKSDTRRGNPTVYRKCGHRKAALTGDYILSVASEILAKIGNPEVVSILSQVLEDLIKGECMQLGSNDVKNSNECFEIYLDKTYKKTASLIANSCKAVAVLSDCSKEVQNIAYEYAKNIGLTFQLIDDKLDVTASEDTMGKPTSVDLKLGLATAPVLFAAQEYPELHNLIKRRFSEPEDVEKARKLIANSEGVLKTKLWAEELCNEAIDFASKLRFSQEQQVLIHIIPSNILNRDH